VITMPPISRISYNRDLRNVVIESNDRYDVIEDINYVMFDRVGDNCPELPVSYNNFISDDFSFKLSGVDMSVIKSGNHVNFIVGKVI
jgi:hypothetical protein